MKPYLDGGFLLVLLTRTPATSIASAILRQISPPIQINFLHQLQADGLALLLALQPACYQQVIVSARFGPFILDRPGNLLAQGVRSAKP